MTKPRNYQTEAIITKKTKLGEADRILTLYTPYMGKIQGIAKGVRRPRSKLSGHLELLTHSQISLARGRGIDTIIGSQALNSFLELKSDLDLTSQALYTTELVNQFTAEHIENHPLFELLLKTLEMLCEGGDNELVLHYFELNLLERVGYRPQLERCVSCRLPLKPITNSFCPSAGGMLCLSCTRSQSLAYPVSVNGLTVLRLLQDGDYNTAGKLRMDSELSHELERIMRNYLRYLLEREIKSTVWLDTLRQQSKQT